MAIASLGLNDPDEEYVVHVLGDDVSALSKSRVEASAGRNVAISWTEVEVAGVREVAWVSRATYLRLIADRYLPPELERALYLDADVVILGSLRQVLEMNLGGNPLGAPRNTSTPFVAWPGGLTRYRELGLDPRAPYLAAGMLLYDLDQWRENGHGAALLDYCQRTGATDQSALNVHFYGRWTEMPLWYHQQFDVYDDSGWTRVIFDDVDRARDDPLVVTFGGALKPWHAGGDGHPLFHRWLEARGSIRMVGCSVAEDDTCHEGAKKDLTSMASAANRNVPVGSADVVNGGAACLPTPGRKAMPLRSRPPSLCASG